jgi:Zn-finger nucleic acid-binding protein
MVKIKMENAIIKCPRCMKDMKQLTRNDVTIDYCKKCGGLWLDKGEMEKLIAMQAKPMSNTKTKK